MNEFTLSEDQQEIFNSYVDGENIFITGPGGCGKSFLIKQIYNHAKEHNKNIHVTALTGCAAILLGSNAKTLHSWSGIGLAKADDTIIATRIEMNKWKKKNWKKTQILIIDEVSMMSKRLFNLLDFIGKKVRKSSKPFGGIQVIFCGDFYQLPPVGNCGDPDSLLFCFESELWDQTFDSQYILDKSYRQTDETYITILNQIREGNLHKYYYNILKQRVNVDYPHNLPIKPVILYPTKRNVDAINYSEMEKIQENEVLFTYKIDLHLPSLEEHIPVDMDIETTSNFEKVEKEYNDKDLFIQKVNYLEKHHILSKLNANIKKGEPKYPSVKELKQSVTYLEKNSYFSTIKKFKVGSQVMCTANLDIEKGIYNGSVGYITEIKDTLIKVKFNNGLEEWIGYHNCEVENLPQVSFQQIPLILAWAITIHKSQGATLDCAEIDVGRSVFADGQTYVALSRVRSLEGLYLKSLDKSRITVNKKVVKFYEQFYE
jgi:ATP-dependent DNA helicase PIF1